MKFTSQHVSINSYMIFRYIYQCYLFTSQHVSINSDKPMLNETGNTYLHPNMYLLILQEAEVCDAGSDNIYIPTCIY